jgi:CheY-like chemotaxis protein
MKVLLVEDQADQVAAIIGELGDSIEFTVATTRDAALEDIAAGHYDIAVCDLKIPPSGDTAPEVEHGLAVLTALRSQCPGTPIIAFTANRTTEVMQMLLNEQRQEDYLGTLDDRPMLLAIDKDQLLEFLEILRELRHQIEMLEQIQVVVGLGQPLLDVLSQRVLRMYARQRGCTITRVEPLTAGQSGVPVLRVAMEKADGSAGGSAVARLASVPEIIEERRRYQQRVSGFLPIGSYAEIVGHVRAGAANRGGVFYQLAKDYRPMFSLLIENDAKAAAAVRRLNAVQLPWRDGAPAVDMSVGDIRQILINDQRWNGANHRCGLDAERVAAIEAISVPVRRGTAHADLHGENVLVDGEPVIIDFLSVSDAPTPLDAVSLELSVLFHPHAPSWNGPWPSTEQLENWADFATYSAGCPFPSFLEACREWAMAVARGNSDLHSCRYAYVASQARFQTSSEDRLRALMADFPAALR